MRADSASLDAILQKLLDGVSLGPRQSGSQGHEGIGEARFTAKEGMTGQLGS
jgi:hypothetical protein